MKNPLYDRLNLPFNVQTLISGGKILGMTAKANLYNDGRGYEKRYFNEWSTAAADALGGTFGTIEISLDGQRKIPFGRPIIHVTDGEHRFNIAQAICEEKWVATQYDGAPYDDSRYAEYNIIPTYAEHLGSKDGLALLIANASPPAPLKMDKHVHLNKLAAGYADVVVDTDGLGSSGSTFAQYGHRSVVQNGEVLAQGERMSFKRLDTTTATVTLKNAPKKTAQKAHVTLNHNFKNLKAHKIPALAYEETPHSWDAPNNPHRPYEEAIRYTAFWLFDYMRKTGMKGVMEALSGGADSGFNATMVAVMVHMGVKELGVATFCDELGLKNKDAFLKVEKKGGIEAAANLCLNEFLTCVYMGTNNSSAETQNAARFLMEGGIDPVTGENVKGIGGKFLNRNVQDLLDFYGVLYAVEDTTVLSPKKKQALVENIGAYLNLNPNTTTAEKRAKRAEKLKKKYPEIHDLITAADGVTYENIQASGRAVLIKLFANKEGKMAVANPNLDEARNAYATFCGDLHAGTINLNTHLPKDFELALMRHLYEHGLHGVMPPVRALGPILRNVPSAELQPKSADGKVTQTDEDALERSFAQMNKISELMLYAKVQTESGERRMNAQEVFAACQKSELFADVDENRLYNMVRLSYNRWYLSQHKIHATPVGPTWGSNVDHQTSQRTPNFSGESKDELDALGLELMFKWSEADGVSWDNVCKQILTKRSWQDETFKKAFGSAVWSGEKGMSYNLRRVYKQVAEKGWESIVKPLPTNHPIMVVQAAHMKAEMA